MNYVVVDLEWNQAMSSKSSVFNKLPIHLRGEIIQIGAVRLNEDMTPGEEFQVDVRPVYFKRMHYKVKKLTGFDKERLSHGLPFAEAFEPLETARETCVLRFADGTAVLRHLRETGVTATASGDAPWTRTRLGAFNADYAARFPHPEGGVALTYEPFWFVGRRR